ncbi:hypothetical protein [Haliangium sp.]|uniref:hypothetical protein n=1 Tax=Haliangium sp. TaxID=2663208 RepID=UPI003D0F4AC8
MPALVRTRLTGLPLVLLAVSSWLSCGDGPYYLPADATLEPPDPIDARVEAPDASIPDAAPPADATQGVDAAPADAAQDDGDGDGVGDDDDNCPNVSNPDQHDEDDDQVGDACDNCPADPNPDQEDLRDDEGSGGDGVGDACDPRPDQGGDRLLLFDGFGVDSAGVPPGWLEASGNKVGVGAWSVEDDQLVQTAATTTDSARLYVELAAADRTARVVVEAAAVVATVSTTDDAHIGIMAVYDNDASDGVSNDSGLACTVERADANPPVTNLRLIRLPSSGSRVEAGAWSFEPARYRLRLVQHPTLITDQRVCEVDRDGQRERHTAALSGPTEGNVGVEVDNVQVGFEYLLVYAVGGDLPSSP